MRYIWHSQVKEVYEEYKEINHRKDENGKLTYDTVSTGWWVTSHDNISYPVGTERPEINVGDTVKLTMEKVS